MYTWRMSLTSRVKPWTIWKKSVNGKQYELKSIQRSTRSMVILTDRNKVITRPFKYVLLKVLFDMLSPVTVPFLYNL